MDQEVKPWRRPALIFPGQGSQHVGMGERLVQVSKAARDIFKRADEVLETRLSKLCFEGPEEELESTINQQPATFVTSIAWLEALRERWASLDRKIEPYIFAGHSMGEFTAAVAAGSLTFEEGLLLVKERGILMDEAGREFPGGMASILGLPEENVAEICKQAAAKATSAWPRPTARARTSSLARSSRSKWRWNWPKRRELAKSCGCQSPSLPTRRLWRAPARA